MKDYTLQEELGEGGFAKVYKGIKQNGEVFAVKELKTSFQIERYIEGELEIIKQKLQHKNIVKLFEYFIEDKIYIVMEFCEMGNLNDYMVQNETIVSQRISFMSDMALGVNYLHGQNIIHRDLKPENILLTERERQIICKITDFGVSRIKLSKYDKFYTYVGSYPYMAPEITGEKEYGSEVDIFALGLLFYAVFRNTVLTNSFGQRSLIPGIYIEKNRIAYLNEVMKREKPNEQEFLVKYFKESSPFGKFIFSMLHIQAENRPLMDSVLVQVTQVRVQHDLNPVIQRQEETIMGLQKQNDDLQRELHENSERERLEKQAMQETIAQNGDTNADLQKQVTLLLEGKETLNTELQQQREEIQELNENKRIIQEKLDQKAVEKAEQEKQLDNLRDQRHLNQIDNEKQMEKLNDLIKEKEITIENIQKQNKFEMKEIIALKETHGKERKVWAQRESEKHEIIAALEQECARKQEEIIDIRNEYKAIRQTLQDEAKNRDADISNLQKENTDLHEAIKERDEKIGTLLGNVSDQQQIINQKEQDILSVREEIRQRNAQLISIEKEKLSKEQSLREKLISVQQLCQNECEGSKKKIDEANIAVNRLQEELIKREATLLKQEQQYIEKEKHWQLDLQSMNNDIEGRDIKIKELYQYIDELPNLNQNQNLQQQTHPPRAQIDETDDSKKPPLIPGDKDEAPDKQAPSGGGTLNKQVISFISMYDL